MTFIKHVFLASGIILFITTACKKTTKKEDEVTVVPPTVTTSEVLNITHTTATGGGMINLNIGEPVTASGICYSKANNTPSVNDDTTWWHASMGVFAGQFTHLTPGTTYYVRAYAINKAGIGYGKVVTFRTLTVNTAPEVKNIIISGDVQVNTPIAAQYTYFDADNDPEGRTRFQWYIADDSTGAPVTPVTNATNSIYTLKAGDQNKFLRAGIIPEATAGATPGTELRSAWVGPVKAEPTSVTFTYNGQTVTYGIIISATTGRKWLDRNLGAPDVPNAYNDWQNMGDLFQWGRKADGHQLVKRAATIAATTAVHGITNILSSNDDPGHAQFIRSTTVPLDWRVPQKGDLWQSTGGVNNVCPTGWHVPSEREWLAEQLGTVQDAYNTLKITTGGFRWFNDGRFAEVFTSGKYWTSSAFYIGSEMTPAYFDFSLTDAAKSNMGTFPAMAYSVRCIKD